MLLVSRGFERVGCVSGSKVKSDVERYRFRKAQSCSLEVEGGSVPSVSLRCLRARFKGIQPDQHMIEFDDVHQKLGPHCYLTNLLISFGCISLLIVQTPAHPANPCSSSIAGLHQTEDLTCCLGSLGGVSRGCRI